MLGTSMDPYKATLILGVMELAGAILCVISVHWTGKRPLLIISTSLTGICLIILAAYSYCRIVNPEAVTNLNWIPVVFLNSSAFLLHAGIRLLPWVLIGEVILFLLRVRLCNNFEIAIDNIFFFKLFPSRRLAILTDFVKRKKGGVINLRC